jgi:hypothetical protein
MNYTIVDAYAWILASLFRAYIKIKISCKSSIGIVGKGYD